MSFSEPIAFIPPEPSALSELLDGYEVSSLVATGGMGAVYRAIQVSLDREVAIKLLPEELNDPTFREQFKAEACAMAKLNHVNLIGIYDYGDANGMPYIVMEYVAGNSLYYSSYGKAIDQQTALELVIGISRGLAAAHDSGIIHRDIKPANILLDPDATPKIGDFGLASPADEEGEAGGVVYGTPGYAAPEIFANQTAIGVPSDLYAVGIILYELLTGHQPEKPAIPPSSIANCDKRLDAIFKKATRRNPALRYQSATELADELQEIRSTTSTDQSKKPATALKQPLTQKVGDDFSPENEGEAALAGAKVKPGSYWPTIRNLVIIATLIPAIIFTWDVYRNKEEDRASEKWEMDLESKNETQKNEALKEALRLDAIENQRLAREEKLSPEKPAEEVMPEPPPEVAKTPMEELAQFRGALHNGRPDQFPKGSIDRTTHTLFVIDQPMTWSQAAEFAELHGGHLATPSTEAEVGILAKRMEGEHSRIWLGGGATGKTGWAWVNGEPWSFSEPGITLGSCAVLTDTGAIKARPNAEKNPFVIQWSQDGSNLGTIALQLERLSRTLDSPNPAWPPSTVSQENRSYLLVYKSVSWDEAALIASSADGSLSVISHPLEGAFISDYLQSALPPQQSAWLGGQLQQGGWTWASGEPWTQASWAPDSPNGDPSNSALRFLNAPDAAGWDDAKPEAGGAQSFLIEWSQDASTVTPAGKVANPGNTELIKLQRIGSRLVAEEVKVYQKALLGNRKQFMLSAKIWHRLLTKNNRRKYQKAYLGLEETIPANGDLSGEIKLGNLPSKIHEEFEKGLNRQVIKENDLNLKLSNLRLNYLKKLQTMRESSDKAGLKTQVARIEAEMKAVGNSGQSFRAYLSK